MIKLNNMTNYHIEVKTDTWYSDFDDSGSKIKDNDSNPTFGKDGVKECKLSSPSGLLLSK